MKITLSKFHKIVLSVVVILSVVIIVIILNPKNVNNYEGGECEYTTLTERVYISDYSTTQVFFTSINGNEMDSRGIDREMLERRVVFISDTSTVIDTTIQYDLKADVITSGSCTPYIFIELKLINN